jgi:hypothetical protein
MDADERELFARSIEHALTDDGSTDLDATLDDLGWTEALASDARAAVATLFELQGAANVVSSALDDVLVSSLGIMSDEPVAIVLPELGRRAAPARLDRERIGVDGLATSALSRRPSAALVVDDGLGCRATLVDRGDLAPQPIAGIDPRLRWSRVSGAPVVASAQDLVPDAWTEAVAAGQRAVGHELVGASRAMLAQAREHAAERVQFGRPIGSFQAVRHRLAEALVAVEAADAALSAAWDAPSPRTALVAKALAGRGARIVGRHCQQVLAGIGFTTEHPFHRYFERVLVLDQLFGSARTLTAELGEELIRTQRMPPLLPL